MTRQETKQRRLGNIAREMAYHCRRRRNPALFTKTQTERALETKMARAIQRNRR